ncbi:hypothetical protein ACFE04_005275 [Oxalis oulophora]
MNGKEEKGTRTRSWKDGTRTRPWSGGDGFLAVVVADEDLGGDEDDIDKKHLPPKCQMTPVLYPLKRTCFRSILSWVFIILLMVYILYTSHLLFNSDRQDCLSTEEHLKALSNTSLQLADDPKLQAEEKLELNCKDREDPEPVIIMKPPGHDTELKHIVFGIAASSSLWDSRKEYIKVWWKPNVTRGIVWLDSPVKVRRNEGLPEIKISQKTSSFKYTNRQGQRSALRISRVVSETFRLGLKDVRWFVMGDDDTVFCPDNVVRILSKYDHTQFYYVGSNSESHVQNIYFSYAMAYGGGGFAISYPLAMELQKMQDRCIQRYPALYGSDDRIQACMAEFGVPLTKERGFHQYDVYGDLLGLLGAHPVTPLASIHHLDVVQPIFPDMSRVKSLHHLFQSVRQDSASVMQQSICYDRQHFWSISVSWGYVVQIVRGVMSPRELEMPTRTFLNWYKRADYTAYAFNTRPVMKHPCQKPFVFYMNTLKYDRSRKQTIGIYHRRKKNNDPQCRWKMTSPERVSSVVVLKKPDSLRWDKVWSVARLNSLESATSRFKVNSALLGCNQASFTGLEQACPDLKYVSGPDLVRFRTSTNPNRFTMNLNVNKVGFYYGPTRPVSSHRGEIVVEFFHHQRDQQCTYGWEIVVKEKLAKSYDSKK